MYLTSTQSHKNLINILLSAESCLCTKDLAEL